jgi:hypothetical protein
VRLLRRQCFHEDELTREHIVPFAQNGQDHWMNVVTACRACNHRKSSRTPEQAHMPLLYAPYVPSLWEDFILRNRRILADQMEFLMAHLPRSSRLQAGVVAHGAGQFQLHLHVGHAVAQGLEAADGHAELLARVHVLGGDGHGLVHHAHGFGAGSGDADVHGVFQGGQAVGCDQAWRVRS